MTYRNPDIAADPAGISQALRALKLPARPPTEEDVPCRNGTKPNIIAGQVTVDEMLEMIEAEDGCR